VLPFLVVPSLLFILAYSISQMMLVKAAVLVFFIFSIFYCSIMIALRCFFGKARVFEGSSQALMIILVFALFVPILRELVIEGPAQTGAILRGILLAYAVSLYFYVFYFKLEILAKNQFVTLLSLALWLPVLLNFGLYLLGVEAMSQDRQAATMLSSVGVNIDRVRFFFSYGINSYAPICSLALLSAFFLSNETRQVGVNLGLRFLVIIASFSSLLLVDSRGSLVVTTVVIFLVWFLRWKPSFIKSLFFLAPFLFLLLPFLNLSLLGALQRNEAELLTLNNRTNFWLEAFLYLVDFRAGHFFGHHLFFQPEGFKVYSLGNDFGSSHFLFTFHNSMIQLLMQIGYLGVFIFVVHSYRLASLFKAHVGERNGAIHTLLSAILYILLIGNIESVFTPTLLLFPIIFLLFNGILLYSKARPSVLGQR
jgi:hypothetical protein